MFGFLGRGAVTGGERAVIRTGDKSILGNVGGTLFSGVAFLGKELTSGIGEIIALGGALVVFLLSQARK